MKKVIKFIKENGFTSLLLILVSLVFLVKGNSGLALLSIGVFLGRNWEIIRNLLKEGIDKIEDKLGI
jgi:hypothetical protein